MFAYPKGAYFNKKAFKYYNVCHRCYAKGARPIDTIMKRYIYDFFYRLHPVLQDIKAGVKLTVVEKPKVKSLFSLCMDTFSRPQQLYILEYAQPI
jgi:hypothetical protein